MVDGLVEAIEKSWPMALGIALSPGPLLAVIVLLMSPKAKTNAPSFLIGWLLAILTVGVLMVFLPGVEDRHGGLNDTTGIVKIIIGFALMIAAIPIWKKRPKSDAPKKVPKMFQNIGKLGMGKSFLAGFLTAAVDIKVLALTASAVVHIRVTSLVKYTETLLGVFLFTIISSLTFILPVVVYFSSPEKMEGLAKKFKTWLLEYYTGIIVTMLVIFGIVLVYIGLKIYLT